MADLACDIHYRTSKAFDSELAHRADEWGVSRNEVARRLAVLAHFKLSVADHRRVEELADTMSTNFVTAVMAIAALGDTK